MRVSEKWLRDWVNPNLSTAELVELLTMAGLEVDAVEAVAGAFHGVVVGEIISAEPHPDASKLQVCQVDIGQGELLQIVCGAANARPGIRVPCATVGAELPGDFKIKQAKLRGVDSMGMLCAAEELGMAEKSDGLMELPSDAPVGQDIRTYLALDDVAIDVDLTPNRGDCLGVAGLAREIGVLCREAVTRPEVAAVKQTIDDSFPVQVDAKAACPRYLGRVIRNVDLTRVTPIWMVERLRRSGIRSIDAVVDVTNYVLLELGQPLHAFDLGKLNGSIRVRMAEEQEPITLLDGQEVKLQADTLVIADDSKPLAVAGIMGGEDSGVTTSTQSIFLETAYFDPIAIAGKARRLGLHTDASHRYERGVDFELQSFAVERATQLLLDIVGGEAGPVVAAVSEPDLPSLPAIQLRRDRIERILGCGLPDQEVEDILSRLGMDIVTRDSGWHVVPPSYRFDVRLEEDLIEELGRVWGYNQLPVTLPVLEATSIERQESQVPTQRFKQLLVDLGFQEAITYSFVDSGSLELLAPGQDAIKLTNPISADMSHMRTTLWAGLLKTAKHNLNRQQHQLKLFETGLVFQQSADGLNQVDHIGGLLSGNAHEEHWTGQARPLDFYDLKGAVEALLDLVSGGNSQAFQIEMAQHPALHPGQSACIKKGDSVIGHLGTLHPLVQKSLDLPQKVYLFELVLTEIQQKPLPKFKELSKFPEVRRDFAVIVDENIQAEAILQNVREIAGSLLTELVLFDVYQGESLGAGRKSIAFGITLQDVTKTLQDEDIAPILDKVINSLKTKFNVTLRE